MQSRSCCCLPLQNTRHLEIMIIFGFVFKKQFVTVWFLVFSSHSASFFWQIFSDCFIQKWTCFHFYPHLIIYLSLSLSFKYFKWNFKWTWSDRSLLFSKYDRSFYPAFICFFVIPTHGIIGYLWGLLLSELITTFLTLFFLHLFLKGKCLWTTRQLSYQSIWKESNISF